MKPHKCHWCTKVIPHKAKLVEINLYIGKIKKTGDRRFRQTQWNFHARCFEDCTGIPILPVEIKAIIKKELKNEFVDPKKEKEGDRETTIRENSEQGLV